MSNALASLLAQATAPGTAPKLIIDAASYAQRVLLQNRDVPWDDATAYANHLGQAQALLRPLVALIPLDRMFEREIEGNAGLREAMSARSRTGFAAKTLLADEGVRKRAVDIVATAVKTQREPVVVHLPSPLALLVRTTVAAHPGADLTLDLADDAENTAIYYADWLRIFADHGIAGIVFDERSGTTPSEAYQPILGAAEHYRWPVGLRSTTEVRFLSPEASVPVLDPSVLGEAQATDLPAGGVLLAEIPEDAVPEQVLARLESLRATA